MATILIFEDDVALALHWRKILETSNHSVCCCTTVEDALNMATTTHPDLVVIDMMVKQGGQFIPKGGLTLLSQLKLHYEESPYIIGVSGFKPGMYSQSTALEIAKHTGVDIALYKPISAEQLSNAVAELLANRH
ncbi:MAG: response regulator [Cyanobacteria bacterium P01_H01_bin.21]